MLTTAALVGAIAAIDARIATIGEQLDAADRVLGDGDTGITVTQVVTAWKAASPSLPVDVGAALLALGRETARATGSSLGAVLAIGLSAGGRVARGREALAPAGLAMLLATAITTIGERSGAAVGDKSIVDSLVHIERRLAAAERDTTPLDAACLAAAEALAQFRDRESKLGRARMYGAKSVGHDDPGMLAAWLLLEAVRDA